MRRRYVWDVERKEMVEVGAEYEDIPRRAQTVTEELVYGGLRATDGTPIDTRKRHRDYMKANGLSLASDFTEHHARAAKERAEFFRTGGDHKERREQIGRALYQQQTKRKR